MARVAQQEVMDMVVKLVSEDHRAVDFELGTCRFCNARIESWDPRNLEKHRPDCPWEGVRRRLGLT